MTERSYADRADSGTNFDPETQFDKDVEIIFTADRAKSKAIAIQKFYNDRVKDIIEGQE